MTRAIVAVLTLAFTALTACDVSQNKPKVESLIQVGSLFGGGRTPMAGSSPTFGEVFVGKPLFPRITSDGTGTRLRGPGISQEHQTRI